MSTQIFQSDSTTWTCVDGFGRAEGASPVRLRCSAGLTKGCLCQLQRQALLAFGVYHQLEALRCEQIPSEISNVSELECRCRGAGAHNSSLRPCLRCLLLSNMLGMPGNKSGWALGKRLLAGWMAERFRDSYSVLSWSYISSFLFCLDFSANFSWSSCLSFVRFSISCSINWHLLPIFWYAACSCSSFSVNFAYISSHFFPHWPTTWFILYCISSSFCPM